jgi:dUTPase
MPCEQAAKVILEQKEDDRPYTLVPEMMAEIQYVYRQNEYTTTTSALGFINPLAFSKGDKIAQLIIYPVVIAELEEVSELSESSRGHGRFGSTGK